MTEAAPRFDAVCFDCDSTLSRIEGIDELAARAGVEDLIAPLTSAAMDGSIPLDAVYGKRLDIVRPDAAALSWLGARYIADIVPGALDAVRELQANDGAVYIVSGGLRGCILPLVDALGLDADSVHAVDVFFDRDGRYRDFDQASPLTRPDGKARVCGRLLERHRGVALVGDGVTDVTADAAGIFVVGFGGVVAGDGLQRGERQRVGRDEAACGEDEGGHVAQDREATNAQ